MQNKIKIKELFQFKDKTGEYKVNLVAFIIKSIAAFLVVLTAISAIGVVWEMVIDEAEYSGQEYYLSRCEQLYMDREFSQLYDNMNLYNLTEPEYDKYWELVNGYQDNLLYLSYRSVQEQGKKQVDFAYINGEEESTRVHFDAEEKIQFYGNKVRENAENCRFESNERYLAGFAEK